MVVWVLVLIAKGPLAQILVGEAEIHGELPTRFETHRLLADVVENLRQESDVLVGTIPTQKHLEVCHSHFRIACNAKKWSSEVRQDKNHDISRWKHLFLVCDHATTSQP